MDFTNFQENDPKEKEIATPILKVRGKTLIFENTVYQISNISSVSLVDLSTTKPMPKYFVVLLVVGISLLFTPIAQARVLGIIALVFLIWQVIEYTKKKLTKRYGIGIFLNSGITTILVSGQYEFMLKVILVLNNIMNSDELTAITFNLDQSKIHQDTSIQINQMTGSNLITGTVQGNIASSV